jgi:hypothetical protein
VYLRPYDCFVTKWKTGWDIHTRWTSSPKLWIEKIDVTEIEIGTVICHRANWMKRLRQYKKERWKWYVRKRRIRRQNLVVKDTTARIDGQSLRHIECPFSLRNLSQTIQWNPPFFALSGMMPRGVKILDPRSGQQLTRKIWWHFNVKIEKCQLMPY